MESDTQRRAAERRRERAGAIGSLILWATGIPVALSFADERFFVVFLVMAAIAGCLLAVQYRHRR